MSGATPSNAERQAPRAGPTVSLTIDGQTVEAPAGASLLEVCRGRGIDIPTLCHRDGYEPFTSCMLCVVKNLKSGALIPACSAPVQAGMTIGASDAEVREARRVALELLLSDHVGDCDAPCRRICPAGMDIALMNRLIAAGRQAEAIRVVKADIPLPAILGRICPAPCEKGCRRKEQDAPLSICLLKRYVADADLASPAPYLPACRPDSGRRVAIVGAGPAGLSTAWYLRLQGHACTVFDGQAAAGGALRSAVPRDRLPAEVVDAECGVIASLGVIFRMGERIGESLTADRLAQAFDAVVLAIGPGAAEAGASFGVATDAQGLRVAAGTYQTSRAGFFATGAAVRPSRLAVRALADGKAAAACVHQFLTSGRAVGVPERFNSVIGKLKPGEVAQFMPEASAAARTTPAGGALAGFGAAEARAEAERCLHCDCRKTESCRLRACSDAYGAKQARYKGADRRAFVQIRQHADVLYEPGKCIRCGLCVRITEQAREPLGLSFVGRGFDVRVAVPFDEPLSRGLGRVAGECVEACPTGALAFRRGEDP